MARDATSDTRSGPPPYDDEDSDMPERASRRVKIGGHRGKSRDLSMPEEFPDLPPVPGSEDTEDSGMPRESLQDMLQAEIERRRERMRRRAFGARQAMGIESAEVYPSPEESSVPDAPPMSNMGMTPLERLQALARAGKLTPEQRREMVRAMGRRIVAGRVGQMYGDDAV